MKKALAILTVLALLCCLPIPVALAGDDTPSYSGTVYYVDSQAGDDANAGTSENAPWQTLQKVSATTFAPGDAVLLKRGGVWDGGVTLRGTGTITDYITLGAYGTGDMPLLSGGGVDAVVKLYNASYWVVENLEITNTAETEAQRYGIQVTASVNKTTYHGFIIRNNSIHDITSFRTDTSGEGAGIQTLGAGWYTGFSDILIENNQIYNVGGNGMTINGGWRADPEHGGKNVIIRRNYLYNIGCDGILVQECQGPLTEYNVVHTSHNRSVAAEVAIWPFDCTDAVFQFNEAYNTLTRNDGQGFDCDYMSSGTVFQYNYGHDNEGGFMLICTEETNWDGSLPAFNDGSIVRYNIGQNNGGAQFTLVGNITNTQIYNNTLYTRWGLDARVISVYTKYEGYPDNTRFYNNLFYDFSSPSDGQKYSFQSRNTAHDGFCTNTVWENNLVYGTSANQAPTAPDTVEDGQTPVIAAASGNIVADPRLKAPGGAGIGFESCDAYYLYDDSPALNAGKVLPDNGERDFFGNPVSAVGPANIGAYNGAGVPDQSEPVYYDNNYVQAVDWENNVAGSTNGRLWYVGYCYSLVQLQSDLAGLSPGTGSTTGVRLSNNRTSTGNCTAALSLGYLPERHRSTGMRFWMSGDGTARSGYLEFTTASAKYKLNVQIPAEGGWIEADWNGRFYNNTVWKYETVTPQIMRTASSVTIAVNSLPAGEGIYIDDIQWKVDRIDTPDETTSGSGSATTGDSSTTTTTTAAASTTTTAPTQAPTTAPAPEPGDSVYVRTAVDFDAADGAASTDGGPATVLSKVAAADLQADYAGFGTVLKAQTGNWSQFKIQLPENWKTGDPTALRFTAWADTATTGYALIGGQAVPGSLRIQTAPTTYTVTFDDRLAAMSTRYFSLKTSSASTVYMDNIQLIYDDETAMKAGVGDDTANLTLANGDQSALPVSDGVVTLPLTEPTAPLKTLTGWMVDGKLYPAGAIVAATADTVIRAAVLTFEMADGASIRLNIEKPGLRFQTSVSTGEYNALANAAQQIEQGTLLIAADNAVGALTLDTPFAVKLVDRDNGFYAPDSNEITSCYYGSVVGIGSENFTSDICARGYLTVTYADNSTATFYTVVTATRNIRQTADNIKNAGDGYYDGLSSEKQAIIDQFATPAQTAA